MYNSYFRFSDSPFENIHDQRFLFLSSDHKEVLSALLYFIRERKAFALCCGDVGTGKTMLINSFLGMLPEHITPIIIVNPMIEYNELLLYIARKLGINPNDHNILDLVEIIKEALIQAVQNGNQYVLIIDEAHLLSDKSLEDIRLLSNIEIPTRKLLQILLVGQYELSYKLDKPELRQLRQRININRFLSSLDADETIRYIDHRLRVVGSCYEFCFEQNCKDLIYKLTGGIPRLINHVCDNALLITKSEGLRKVNRHSLKKSDASLRSDKIFAPRQYVRKYLESLKKLLRPLFFFSVCFCVLLIILTGIESILKHNASDKIHWLSTLFSLVTFSQSDTGPAQKPVYQFDNNSTAQLFAVQHDNSSSAQNFTDQHDNSSSTQIFAVQHDNSSLTQIFSDQQDNNSSTQIFVDQHDNDSSTQKSADYNDNNSLAQKSDPPTLTASKINLDQTNEKETGSSVTLTPHTLEIRQKAVPDGRFKAKTDSESHIALWALLLTFAGYLVKRYVTRYRNSRKNDYY